MSKQDTANETVREVCVAMADWLVANDMQSRGELIDRLGEASLALYDAQGHPQESNEPRQQPPQGQPPSGHKQEQDDET